MRCSRRETSASKLWVEASLVGVWASAVKGSLSKTVEERKCRLKTARRTAYRRGAALMQAGMWRFTAESCGPATLKPSSHAPAGRNRQRARVRNSLSLVPRGLPLYGPRAPLSLLRSGLTVRRRSRARRCCRRHRRSEALRSCRGKSRRSTARQVNRSTRSCQSTGRACGASRRAPWLFFAPPFVFVLRHTNGANPWG